MPKVTEKHSQRTEESTSTPDELQHWKSVADNKNQEDMTKDQELERTRNELEELKKVLMVKSEFKGENETHLAAAQRRLAIHPTKDMKNTLKIWNLITADAKPEIQPIVLETISSMRGKTWLHGTCSVCVDFQMEKCPQGFLHYNKYENANQSHVCVLCVKIFEIGMAQPALHCPTLRLLDENHESQQMQL